MPELLAFTACAVDLDAAEARWTGRVERLTATEVRLLRRLADAPGATVDKATLLREVWGYKPGVASRTVDTTVQRLRLKLEVEPDAPKHLLTVYGLGYRLVLATTEAAGAGGAADGLVGRVRELEHLGGRLAAGPGLVTLVGPGGAGKSRLARRAAEQARGGAVLVPLGDVLRLDAALDRVGVALGVALADPDTEAAIAQLGRALAARGVVIVLDDVQRVGGGGSPARADLDADEPTGSLERAIQAWAGVARVLVTAPVPLGLPGEEVLPVPPLAQAEATELLATRARAVGAGAIDGNDPAVEALVRALEGSPLAVELAAARLALLSPGELLERLRRPLDVLASQDQPPRHRSLRAALEGGWGALGDPERTLLGAAAAFPSPFRADDAEAVSGLDEGATLSALEGLVRAGWAQRVAGRAPARFHLLASVRAYAAEQAAARGDRPEIEARLRGWAVDRAERLGRGIDGPGAAQAARQAADDWASLAAAVDTAPHDAAAARVGVALARYATWTRRFREGLHLLRGAPWPGASPTLRVRAHAARVRLGMGLGHDPSADLAAAEPLLAEGDDACRAALRLAQGAVTFRASRYPEARAILAEAAELADRAGDARNAGAARVEASVVARATGDLVGSLALLDAAQARLFAAEATRDLALVESQRGVVLAGLGRRVEAESAYRRALGGLEQVGDEASAEVTRGNLANLLLLDDRVDEAERLLRRVLQGARETGNRSGEAHFRMGLGGVASARGRPADALDAFEQARLLFAAIGARFPAAVCRGLVGRLLHAQGARDAAGIAYRSAAEELRALGRSRGAARIEALAAVVAGDPSAIEPALSALGEDPAATPLRALAADPDGRTPAGADALRVLADTRDRRLLPE